MELENLTTIDSVKAFYEKKFYFSYSSLNKLLFSPQLFYKDYILGEREQATEVYLTEGKLIHCLLLEPENFEKQFVVMHGKTPTENTKIVVDRLFAHDVELRAAGGEEKSMQEYTNAILDILLDMNLHQKLSTDDQRIAKIITPDAVMYWNFLQKSEGKIIVDSATLDKCRSVTDKLRNDSLIQGLMRFNHSSEWWDTTEVYNELPMEIPLRKFNFGLKGILDNIVINPVDKVIRINDLKTTSKTLSDFPETIKFYRYDLQAAIYNLMVLTRYEDLVKQGFKVEFRFIVIDKFEQYYPFLVSEDTMMEWMKNLKEALVCADYHYTKKDYSLPYKFVTGSFIL